MEDLGLILSVRSLACLYPGGKHTYLALVKFLMSELGLDDIREDERREIHISQLLLIFGPLRFLLDLVPNVEEKPFVYL